MAHTSQHHVYDQQQHEEIFTDFQELSRLCVLDGVQSPMCLLRSTWLQGKRGEVRIGARFVLPSRNRLPREAVYSGRIAEDSTFIIVLSYCWASPEHPDPENKLLANVSEFLAYVDVSRHFGDDDLHLQKYNVGDREVLVFWDWPCLYQKKDGDITPLQLDSFKRGLQSVNVLYGHVGTLCLLCTEGHFPPGSRPDYKGSGWPYFESLVSTLIKDQNKAVNLPRALEWVRMTGVNTRKHDRNRSVYWLYEYVRRAERQLPVSPDVFDTEIEDKHITNGNDKQLLRKKYRKTFVAVMKPAKKISLKDLPGPSSKEWRLFLQDTLRWCPRLQHIDLSQNESIAGATLEPFASLGDTLEFLDVSMSAGFAGTLDALMNLRKLRELYLSGCLALEGSVEPLRDLQELVVLDVEACFGLQGDVHVLATLPKLKKLNISDTQLDAEGVVAVDGCQVGRHGTEQTPLWRAANCGQVHTARRLLEGTADQRGVEVDRATTNNGTTPLIQAATQQFTEVAKVLLLYRGNANLARFDGSTPTALRCTGGVCGGGPVVVGARGTREPGKREYAHPAPPRRLQRPRRCRSHPSEESSGRHLEERVGTYSAGDRSKARS